MDNNTIDIKPIEFKQNCVKVKMRLTRFEFNAKSCDVSVEKYNENNVFLEVCTVSISEEEYSQWGSDDNYIINLVLKKLGMERA